MVKALTSARGVGFNIGSVVWIGGRIFCGMSDCSIPDGAIIKDAKGHLWQKRVNGHTFGWARIKGEK